MPAVPVPAAIWLFGTALIGFIGISRRTNLTQVTASQ
ncbi:MAG: PEP-CTERM sorting domain-containing protein [Gammaproteobacteria bacterium]|nr:PEP-CTERM sorting domain-containing protein [Gammaproteobacteria bacterium]